jgi:hypothetical protein
MVRGLIIPRPSTDSGVSQPYQRGLEHRHIRRIKTRETGNRLGGAEVAKDCFHQTIVNLECASCGTEFNELALAEVLDGWERRDTRLRLEAEQAPD